MKNQASFSSKDKSKKLKCRLLQFLFGPLRVKCCGRSGNSIVDNTLDYQSRDCKIVFLLLQSF